MSSMAARENPGFLGAAVLLASSLTDNLFAMVTGSSVGLTCGFGRGTFASCGSGLEFPIKYNCRNTNVLF